jgi:hypothetical protein
MLHYLFFYDVEVIWGVHLLRAGTRGGEGKGARSIDVLPVY